MSNLRQQILAKTLPPIGPPSSRRSVPDSSKKSPIARRDFSPIDWSSYYDDKRHVVIDGNSFCLYTRHMNDTSTPVLFFLHGGGFSGLSWAVLSKTVTNLVRCQCIAIDIRGHGDTKTSDESDLTIETLTKDISQVICQLYSSEHKPPIFLIGHSMGGALAVHVAKECPQMIDALCVIDVVEGSALEALSSMQCFLSSRPKQFVSPEKAIEYMVRSGQVRNLESARVSIIGQIQPITDEKSPPSEGSTATDKLPTVSHVCNTVREEDEDDGNDEQEHDLHHDDELSSPHKTNVEKNSTTEQNKYTWRIDLSKTEPFWKGWFSGLSKLFLSCECPKLLLLAGVDRLDRDLTVGQMQGKFQMLVIPKSGHAVHEDAPEQVADCIASFLIRHKLVQPVDDNFQAALPGC